jgi:hypothetical protein
MRFCILFSSQVYGEVISETTETYIVKTTAGDVLTVHKSDVWVLT